MIIKLSNQDITDNFLLVIAKSIKTKEHQEILNKLEFMKHLEQKLISKNYKIKVAALECISSLSEIKNSKMNFTKTCIDMLYQILEEKKPDTSILCCKM